MACWLDEVVINHRRTGVDTRLRNGPITVDQVLATSADARSVLGDRIVGAPGPHVIAVALECGLSPYDAEFVVLARTLGVRLVTLDQAILNSAGDVAVSLALR